MYKIILPFYLICFLLYIFFTRQPDFADGEFTSGVINFAKDSASQKQVSRASFTVDGALYTIGVAHSFRKLIEGEKVKIIYEAADPQQASVYSLFGYWINWNELIASILIPLILLYVANSITRNPTPEAVIEDIEANRRNRTRYD